MGNMSDESVMDVEKRKYYIQTYEFIMLGFLIDETQFEVSPAISRILQVVEVDQKVRKGKQKRKTSKPFRITKRRFMVTPTTSKRACI